MKKLFLIFFMLLPFIGAAQTEWGSFKIDENRKVVWQVIFDTDLTFEQIYKAVKSEGRITCNIGDRFITGKCEDLKLDLFGRSVFNTVFIVTRNNYSFSYKVDYKQGRYRVTVNNFILKNNYEHELSGALGTISTIEEYTINKKGIFRNSVSELFPILDKNLEQIFTFKNDATDDDW